MKITRSFLAVLLLAGQAQAFDLFGDRSTPAFDDNGDTMAPFSVSIGSVTAQPIYTRRITGTDRRLVVCNATAAFLYVSTFSAANATTSPRTMVPKGLCDDLPPNQNLYGIFEAAAATTTVTGFAQYQARD